MFIWSPQQEEEHLFHTFSSSQGHSGALEPLRQMLYGGMMGMFGQVMLH